MPLNIKNIFSAATTVSLVWAILAFIQIVSTLSTNAQQRTVQKWYKICAKQAESDVCNVQYRMAASNDRVVKSCNLFTVTGRINRDIFQVVIPKSRHIPAGVTIKFDDQREHRIPYTNCFRKYCAAEIKSDENLLSLLELGGEMLITSTDYQRKANSIKVSLAGFAAAFDGPSIKKSELDRESEELRKQLEKKREENEPMIIARDKIVE